MYDNPRRPSAILEQRDDGHEWTVIALFSDETARFLAPSSSSLPVQQTATS